MELYFHSPIRLVLAVLNESSTGIATFFLLKRSMKVKRKFVSVLNEAVSGSGCTEPHFYRPHVEAGSNTCTVTLRVVEGDEKGKSRI
jgi:hypothetical protein